MEANTLNCLADATTLMSMASRTCRAAIGADLLYQSGAPHCNSARPPRFKRERSADADPDDRPNRRASAGDLADHSLGN